MALRDSDGLLGSPAEVLDEIMKNVLTIVGFGKILGLRTICKQFDNLVTRTICHDHMSNPVDGIVDKALWGVPGVAYSSSLIYHPITGALLCQQMKNSSKETVLYPISQALHSYFSMVPHTDEHLHRLEKVVCETALDRLCWHKGGIFPERDSLGKRQVVFRRVQSNDRGYYRVANWDEDSQNILAISIIDNNVAIFRKLLNSGQVDVNFENRYFGRPLHSAARYGCFQIIELLLQYKADRHATQPEPLQNAWNGTPMRWGFYCSGGSALRVAASVGNHHMVRLLLEDSHMNNSPTPQEEARLVLLAAARCGSAQLLSLLEDEYFHNSPLLPRLREEMICMAEFWGNIEVVGKMLDDGVDPDAIVRKDTYAPQRRTPLVLASGRNEVRIVELLLDRGAKLSTCYTGRHLGVSDLTRAAIRGREGLIDVFLNHGAEINGCDCATFGSSVLVNTVQVEDQEHTVHFLLARGASLHTVPGRPEDGSVGSLCLESAILDGNLPLVLFLIDKGVPLKHTNPYVDPITIARGAKESRKCRILEALLQLGAEESESGLTEIAD